MNGTVETVDALGFVADALEASDALVERRGDGIEAILPREVTAWSGLPEFASLALASESTAHIACGVGTPVLERILSRHRDVLCAADAVFDGDLPRANHARALAERFVVRNGVTQVGDTRTGREVYVLARGLWRAEADDRHEGLVEACVASSDGAVPDGAFVEAAEGAALRGEARGAAIETALAPEVLGVVRRALDDALRAAVSHVADSGARRHARDHARIDEYFAGMLSEARSPRRKIDASAIRAKCDQLVAERDARLRDLEPRYALASTLRIATVLRIDTPAVRVELRIRRRKVERTIVLRVPSGSLSLDAPPCAACSRPTQRPAVCDDALHLLCETCAPAAQGRLACQACRHPPGTMPRDAG